MTQAWVRFLPPAARRFVEGRGYLQRVVANTGWVFAERLLRYAVGFLVGVWIARYVGPEQYGLLNYAASLVTVFACISTLGLDSIAVRELVREPGLRNEIIGTIVLLRLGGGALLIVAVTAAIAILRPDDPLARILIILISLAYVAQAFDAIDLWFQSILLARYSATARTVALLIVTIVRIVLIKVQAPLIAFAAAVLAESSLLAIGMLVAYFRFGGPSASFEPRLTRAHALLREGWPLLLSSLVAAVYLRIDQVMLGQMAGLRAVGSYAVAARVIDVPYIIPAVVAASVLPAIIKSRDGDHRQYEARIQRLFSAMLWLAVLIALPLSVFAHGVVNALVGGSFADAGAVLAILAWMPVWAFFGVMRQKWLFAENALKSALAVELAACALNVAANLILIPKYGAVGAAYSALIAAPGATLLLVPFSFAIRRSAGLFLLAVLAPLRALRSAQSHL